MCLGHQSTGEQKQALESVDWNLKHEVSTLIRLVRSDDPIVSLRALKTIAQIRQGIQMYTGKQIKDSRF